MVFGFAVRVLGGVQEFHQVLSQVNNQRLQIVDGKRLNGKLQKIKWL